MRLSFSETDCICVTGTWTNHESTIMHTIQTIHYTLYTIHNTQYTIHYTLYTIHYTLHTTPYRVLSISGEARQCITCCLLVIDKLASSEGMTSYVNKGTSYAGGGMNGGGIYDPMGSMNPMGQMGHGPMSHGSGGPPYGQAGNKRSLESAGSDMEFAPTIITFGVPDSYVGAILGKQGATLREITNWSGARVTVSDKNDFMEGTTNRLITITGPPHCAQAAHHFIQQKLEAPLIPPMRK